MVRIKPWFWEFCNVFSVGLVTPLKLDLEVKTSAPPPAADGKTAILLTAKHVSSFDITVLADLCKRLAGRRPYFQMGSFQGYRVLGAITRFLAWLGGFPVMRPKDLRRLVNRLGLSKEEAIESMRRINAEAEATRRRLLAEGEILVVYPEGTRAPDAVLPLKATTELESAREVVARGGRVLVWPVVLSFEPPRRWRRRAIFHFLEAFPLEAKDSAESVLCRVQREFEAHWVSPQVLESMRAKGSPDGTSRADAP